MKKRGRPKKDNRSEMIEYPLPEDKTYDESNSHREIDNVEKSPLVEEFKDVSSQVSGGEADRQTKLVEEMIKRNDELNRRIAKLESEKGFTRRESFGWEEKVDKPKKRTAMLGLIKEDLEDIDSDWLVVVDRRTTGVNRWNQSKQRNELIYRFTGLKKDGTKVEFDMDLVDYGRTRDFVTVVLEKEYKKELRKKVGRSTLRQDYDYENYKSKPGKVVDQYEEKIDREWDVILPDGRMIHVRDGILNLS